MLLEKIELEPEEKIIKTVRKHWFVVVSQLFGTIFVILLPLLLIAIVALFPKLVPDAISLHEFGPHITFVVAWWLFISLLTGFMIWTHYYLDLWIITDHRIIVVDQISFFNRKVSSFRLERLQDVEVTISGLIATFLNFGNLDAHTAGADEENFSTNGLPDPRSLQAEIQKATDLRLRMLTTPVQTIFN